jgi:hypothetical protein
MFSLFDLIYDKYLVKVHHKLMFEVKSYADPKFGRKYVL